MNYSHDNQRSLGRLFRVDLKTGLKCPSVRAYVRTYVRTYVRPQKVSSISIKFGMLVDVDEWCTTVCSMTRFKVNVKVTSPS